ncbi:MAG: hypothetical protein L6R48_03550, partial [Planctomycetes bacterium]|nr:hypothetical protein [Planctomycetota bacterium]
SELATGTAAAIAAADRTAAQAAAAQQAAWDEAIAAAAAWAAAAGGRSAARHPAWHDPAWQAEPLDARLATADPVAVPLGAARLDLARLAADAAGECPPLALPAAAAIELPLALGLPACASLLIRHDPAARAAALALANQVALRALAAFPPGHLRLVLLDPAGLGDAFTPLLDLADHDEALLGDGVHSGAERIERALDDLAAHLSTVIQKHLRGRYPDLDAYNREAGEMREAVRLVVVAGFPDGFGERALERLGTLAATGARCGVHLVVVGDARRPPPAFLDPAILRQTWVQVLMRDDGCRLEHPGLPATLQPEGLPDPALRGRLLAAVGRAASGGRRIQVPFPAVAPRAEEVWSASTAQALSVPVGRRGADRIQRFELGRGTCQHALVGGRTGSGKSTLFHVLVTNAALWHHPRELEIHLIDFKKGVEFKTYAVNRLPHARVIAIESDREFGLSVLRHLDGEMTRRGEAYRKVGAQDVASYRRTGELPRILLAIDEFQEFFTEDDAIARDAALLLDRFVRQGRAFGLHVVLGSQTLGGAYSLAKSSLGQMGVRVVLPCNESDAHLLLHEDNDGARLLTRPGDAIYNDRAGLADGNSPFQVCWLGEEEQTAHLRALAARAAAEGWKPARPPVVFAGDGPSDLGGMIELEELVARAPAEADARVRAWVGQSSSIAGPAEVVLPAAGGGNLLLVGLNREAAVATLGALAVGLAARHAPGRLRLLLLDGEDADGPGALLWSRLAAALPHGAERVEARGALALLEGLAAELERRQGGGVPAGPILLCVSALQRLRQLRPDDDLGFGGGGGGEAPAERFARLAAQGPDLGLHVAVWCDSLTSVQRSLQRRTLKDFDARILFQMGGADSTELADDDGASRLGLHNALNLGLGEGRREKFRPCALPDPGLLDDLGARLRAKWSQS